MKPPGNHLCQIGRIFDPKHPTCATCQVGCALKSATVPERVPTLAEIGASHGLKPKNDKHGKPNKTESEYATRLAFEFPGRSIEFEAVTLHLPNGHAYTPDWVVKLPDGQILCVEVKARGKNGFRHPSYQRAKVMFDQSRLDWPMFKWRWAEKQSGMWAVEDF